MGLRGRVLAVAGAVAVTALAVFAVCWHDRSSAGGGSSVTVWGMPGESVDIRLPRLAAGSARVELPPGTYLLPGADRPGTAFCAHTGYQNDIDVYCAVDGTGVLRISIPGEGEVKVGQHLRPGLVSIRNRDKSWGVPIHLIVGERPAPLWRRPAVVGAAAGVLLAGGAAWAWWRRRKLRHTADA
ncbi:hypothetical protein [Streptomyces sp. NPDC089919]|uniref:hypothetical protein n=1 Tax=Streptomyces sp. NPDC089919 TaxID=3155188 RepID=UPI003441D5C5